MFCIIFKFRPPTTSPTPEAIPTSPTEDIGFGITFVLPTAVGWILVKNEYANPVNKNKGIMWSIFRVKSRRKVFLIPSNIWTLIVAEVTFVSLILFFDKVRKIKLPSPPTIPKTVKTILRIIESM